MSNVQAVSAEGVTGVIAVLIKVEDALIHLFA